MTQRTPQNQASLKRRFLALCVALVVAITITACGTSVTVLTATPDGTPASTQEATQDATIMPTVMPTSTVVQDPTPTQEIVTLVPTATDVNANCDNPDYSDSFCPINDGLFLSPYSAQINVNPDNGANISVQQVTRAISLDIPDDARNSYNGYLDIDLAWFAGFITITDVLTSEVDAGACYIVRMPYRTNLPVAIGDTYNAGDFDARLRVWSDTHDRFIDHYANALVLGDGEALWVVEAITPVMPLFEIELHVRWAKFVTGADIYITSVEWFEAPCEGVRRQF